MAELPNLAGPLSDLIRLLPESDRPQLADLERRLARDRLRVLVAGEAKRGKSTLVNALLGMDVLPTGVLPLTSVATTIEYGDADGVETTYLDGRREHRGLGDLGEFVTEDRNPGNCQGVVSVVVRLPHPLLRSGLELVDTPGVGSVHEHNTAATREALQSMDAALFVTSADPPVSASERAFLRDVRQLSVRALVVITKADQLASDEISVVRDFVAAVVSETLDRPVDPYVVSARMALAAPDARTSDESGIPRLAAALGEYTFAHGHTDLVRSAAGHAQRLAARAADEIRLTLRSADLSADVVRRRQEIFSDRLADVWQLREEAQALLDSGCKALLRELSTEAHSATLAAVEGLTAEFDEWNAAAAHSTPADIDHRGTEWVRCRAAEAASTWRADHEKQLQNDVGALMHRSQRRLAAQIAAVRKAAAEVFDVPLDAAVIEAGLSTTTRFAPRGAELGGFSDLLASCIRTRLPGSFGRHRVLLHLRNELVETIDRGFGRARADLQARLQETDRQLRIELARQFDTAVARITQAVDRGRELATLHTAELDQLRVQLGDRLGALDRIANGLDQIARASGRDPSP